VIRARTQPGAVATERPARQCTGVAPAPGTLPESRSAPAMSRTSGTIALVHAPPPDIRAGLSGGTRAHACTWQIRIRAVSSSRLRPGRQSRRTAPQSSPSTYAAAARNRHQHFHATNIAPAHRDALKLRPIIHSRHHAHLHPLAKPTATRTPLARSAHHRSSHSPTERTTSHSPSWISSQRQRRGSSFHHPHAAPRYSQRHCFTRRCSAALPRGDSIDHANFIRSPSTKIACRV